jgi:hypothetical protein
MRWNVSAISNVPAPASKPTSTPTRSYKWKSSAKTAPSNTGQVPLEVWDRQLLEIEGEILLKPISSLLDLHFSLRTTRKVNNAQTIDFEGQNYEIGTTARNSVTVGHHPNQKFWVVDQDPKDIWPSILGTFGL